MAGGFELAQRLPGMTCETKSLTGGAGAADVSIERVGRDADGIAVGSDGWLGVQEGVSEIVAVGVLPRRRTWTLGVSTSAPASRWPTTARW